VLIFIHLNHAQDVDIKLIITFLFYIKAVKNRKQVHSSMRCSNFFHFLYPAGFSPDGAMFCNLLTVKTLNLTPPELTRNPGQVSLFSIRALAYQKKRINL